MSGTNKTNLPEFYLEDLTQRPDPQDYVIGLRAEDVKEPLIDITITNPVQRTGETAGWLEDIYYATNLLVHYEDYRSLPFDTFYNSRKGHFDGIGATLANMLWDELKRAGAAAQVEMPRRQRLWQSMTSLWQRPRFADTKFVFRQDSVKRLAIYSPDDMLGLMRRVDLSIDPNLMPLALKLLDERILDNLGAAFPNMDKAADYLCIAPQPPKPGAAQDTTFEIVKRNNRSIIDFATVSFVPRNVETLRLERTLAFAGAFSGEATFDRVGKILIPVMMKLLNNPAKETRAPPPASNAAVKEGMYFEPRGIDPETGGRNTKILDVFYKHPSLGIARKVATVATLRAENAEPIARHLHVACQRVMRMVAAPDAQKPIWDGGSPSIIAPFA